MVMRAFLTFGMALALTLTASAAAADATSKAFRIRLVADPTPFDWHLAATDYETPVMMNIMEGLLEFDAQMKLKSALAESWSLAPDHVTYTFKLRAGVKWSDGRPLAAEDFVYSWQRLLSPVTAAPYAYFLNDIEGAAAFNAGKTTDPMSLGVKALDARTLQVKLRRPVAYFPQLLTFWVTFPMRKDVVERYGRAWSQPGKSVVLGPFIPTSYKPQNEVVLSRNAQYYGKPPAIDTVVLKIINEDSTALNLFKTGQIDFLRPVNFLELAEMRSSPAFHSTKYYRTCSLEMNATKYPFNLPKVRQAVTMAIDRPQLGKFLHRDLVPADSLLSDDIFPQGKGAAPAFDAQAARKLLASSLGNADVLPAAELLSSSSDENALITQFIQDQLTKNLGLKVSINMPEYSIYRSQLQVHAAALYLRCWGADYPDPDTYFTLYTSGSGNNFTTWKNPRYDEFIRKATETQNGPARTKLYKDALTLLLGEEAVINPLYFDNLTFLLNPRVKGFVINPLNYVFFRDISLNP